MQAKESVKSKQTTAEMQECYHIEWTQKHSNRMHRRVKYTYAANQDRHAGVLSLGIDTKAKSWNADKGECKKQTNYSRNAGVLSHRMNTKALQ